MRRMLINTQSDEIRVAITLNGLLVDLDIERPEIQQTQNNIYKAIITSIEPSLGAVFVEYDHNKRHGFLPLKEISPEYHKSTEVSSQNNIHELLTVGQPLVVQVDKEERGSKGAALTTYLSLAGSFLVLMPNNPRAGGVSRRIDGQDRDQMREILSQLDVPENMGLIVRTAGVGRSVEELQWDLRDLLRYWEAIQLAVHNNPDKKSFLIHQESDVISRAIRDNLRQDTNEIIIDDEEVFTRAKQYISKIRPDFVSRIKLYANPLPLFSSYHIEQQIETAYQREVRLPSGGSIVIDHTEALVCIDINSARATRGSNIEETALNTNLEAADEIARQLRLRDIGGLIVIDFIDMTPIRNQREVENRLRDALQLDRARIQIGRISRFGLLEMSRQRLRSSLAMSNQIPCVHCYGLGMIRSVESLSLSILHTIQEQAAKTDYKHFQVQVPISVATYLMNEKRSSVHDAETHYGIHITLVPNAALQSPNYIIRHYRSDNNRASISSYKIANGLKQDSANRKPTPAQAAEPIIKAYLPEAEATPAAAKRSTSGGLIKRLWTKIFNIENETVASENKPENQPGHHKPRHQQQRHRYQQKHHNKPRHDRGHDENPDNRKPEHDRSHDNQGNRHPKEVLDDNRDNQRSRNDRDENRDNQRPRNDRDENRDNQRPRNDRDENRDNQRPRNDRDENRDSQRPRNDRDENRDSQRPRNDRDENRDSQRPDGGLDDNRGNRRPDGDRDDNRGNRQPRHDNQRGRNSRRGARGGRPPRQGQGQDNTKAAASEPSAHNSTPNNVQTVSEIKPPSEIVNANNTPAPMIKPEAPVAAAKETTTQNATANKTPSIKVHHPQIKPDDKPVATVNQSQSSTEKPADTKTAEKTAEKPKENKNSPEAILAAAGFGKQSTSKLVQVQTRKPTDQTLDNKKSSEDN